MNEPKPKVGTPLEVVRMIQEILLELFNGLAGLLIDVKGFLTSEMSRHYVRTVTLFASCRLIFDFYTNREKRNDCRIRLLRRKVFLFRRGSCSVQTIPPGLGIEHNVQSLLIRIIK